MGGGGAGGRRPGALMASILLVDDDPDILRVLAAVFESAGHEAHPTLDPDAVLPLARTRCFDAVVLDVMMPRRSGWEVLEELRRERRTALLPVVMLSAIGDAPNRVRGLRQGADDFLAKPFHPEEIVARVEALVGRRAAEVEGLRGDFATLAVGDVLQSLETTAASGTLEVRTPAGDGTLRLSGGRAVDAAFGGFHGAEAVLALADQRTGTFRLVREPQGPQGDGGGPPLQQVTTLLLTAAWIADELRQRLYALPAEDQPLGAAPGAAAPEAPDGLPELPLAAVLARLAERPGTTLADLLRARLGAPARVKLAVAWLAEEGLVQAVAAQARS